jgi:hypothetical protein
LVDQISAELHALEREFGLPAAEILDTINRRNRCKIAVRGAIAETHLLRYLRTLVASGAIERFEDFDRDGYPDCRVDYAGRSFLVECKNVQKLDRPEGLRAVPIRIDFQRTRNPIDRKWERYYLPDEFQIVAACLWNRTGRWEYRFAATADLPRHPQYPDRLATSQTVQLEEGPLWTASLPRLLERLVASAAG